jgi:hypothetical protein
MGGPLRSCHAVEPTTRPTTIRFQRASRGKVQHLDAARRAVGRAVTEETARTDCVARKARPRKRTWREFSGRTMESYCLPSTWPWMTRKVRSAPSLSKFSCHPSRTNLVRRHSTTYRARSSAAAIAALGWQRVCDRGWDDGRHSPRRDGQPFHHQVLLNRAGTPRPFGFDSSRKGRIRPILARPEETTVHLHSILGRAMPRRHQHKPWKRKTPTRAACSQRRPASSTSGSSCSQ